MPKETSFERIIAERLKSRKGRIDEIKRKESSINNALFKHCFKYSSPSNICNQLSETKGAVNEVRVDLIKKTLTKMKNIVKNGPADDLLKTEENEKIIDVVESILEINDKIQSGQGLKYLIPNQMLSKLPTSLEQLKAGNNSGKLNNEIKKLLYSLYRSKNFTKQLYKKLVDIYLKHRNNFYEQQKH